LLNFSFSEFGIAVQSVISFQIFHSHRTMIIHLDISINKIWSFWR